MAHGSRVTAKATSLAPRLKTLEGKRLGLYLARPGGSSKQTERSVYELLRAIAALVVEQQHMNGAREWRRPSASRRSPLAMLDEIAAESDAVLMGIGDCHHGSACSLTEVWELEERGVPVAYVDTPRRLPRIERNGDAWEVDYFALDRRVPRWKRQGMEKLRDEFELQGINRLLRLAGARPGDRIRVDGTEFELWEYPDSPWMSARGTDGILDYEYVLTAPLSITDPAANVARAEELAPKVVTALLV